MKDIKRELFLFSFYDHTGIRRHLEDMAARGWMLEKAGTLWRYRRAAPKQVRYAIVYFPKASEFDAGPAQGQEVFQDYCAQAGWQPVAKAAQMQIFRSEEPDPLPIETDAVTQVETVHRAMKANFLISQGLLLFLALFQLGAFLMQAADDPVDTLSSTSHLFTAFCFILVGTFCLTELVTYLRWHRRAMAAAAETGRFTETHGHRRFQQFFLALLAVGLVWWLVTLRSRQMLVFALLMLGLMAVLLGVVNAIKALLKRRQVSTAVNRAVTITTAIVLSLALTGGLLWGALRAVRGGWLEDHPPAETYTYHGSTWKVYQDALPLRIEDLTDTDYDGWSYERDVQASPLLVRSDYTQQPRMGAPDQPTLDYTVVQVKARFLYGLCKNDCLRQATRSGDTYLPVDAAPWGAEAAYRYDFDGTALERYLLCYPKRIVTIRFDWTPTPAQMAIVGETLAQ